MRVTRTSMITGTMHCIDLPIPGFFFGGLRDVDSEDVKDVRSFVTDALEAIRAGYRVFYDSWR